MRNGVTAATAVGHSLDAVFEFLADLRNHWLLEDAFVSLQTVDVDGDGAARGGRVRLRGPFGLSRVAATRVVAAEPPAAGEARLRGEALVGARTRARIEWWLTGTATGTRVTLAAEVLEAGPFDRVLLALGGRVWLRRLFGRALRNLERSLPADGAPRAAAPRRP